MAGVVFAIQANAVRIWMVYVSSSRIGENRNPNEGAEKFQRFTQPCENVFFHGESRLPGIGRDVFLMPLRFS